MQQYGRNNKSLARAIYIEEMNLEDFFVVDIREEDEALAARIRGVPNIREPQAICNLAMDFPDKRFLIHCKRGGRASRMGNILVEMGCKNIYFFDDLFSRFYEKFEVVGQDKDCMRSMA